MVEEAQGGETLLSPQPETTPSWHGEESNDLVETKGWKTADDALNSYRELEKSASGKIKMCTPESSAEEIRAFYSKTGCPENPEGYEIVHKDETAMFHNEDMENAVKVAAHEMGISKQGLESVVNAYYEKMASDFNAARLSGEKQLKEDLGAEYEAEISIAQRFCKTCSDEFIELMEATGLGNNPVVIKEFISKGKQTMNDTLIKGGVDGDAPEGFTPRYKDSPEMYATGDDEETQKAREYFTARGHKY